MIGVLVLLPLLALAAAAVLAMVSVKRSTLQITADGVEYRNYPQATQTVPLARGGGFEETVAVGNFSGLRPATAVLVLTDGSRPAGTQHERTGRRRRCRRPQRARRRAPRPRLTRH